MSGQPVADRGDPSPEAALPPRAVAGLAWLLWIGWMAFLVFPPTAPWQAPAAWQRVLGLTATLVFAAGYVWLLRASFAREDADPPGREGAMTAALAAISLAAAPAIGYEAMSFLPFLAAVGAFSLPRPAAWWWVGGVVAVSLILPLLPGADRGFLFLSIVTIAVSAGTVGGRAMQDREAMLAGVREDLAVTAERDRVARDVHDVLGHSLTVVTVKSALARRLVRTDPDRAEAELADIERLSRQALAEVRSTVGGLRATRLEEELADAERALAAAGITAEIAGEGRDLEPQHRAVAAWVLREAVTNVLRHAGASRCQVALSSHALVVTDDGRGLRDRPGGGLNGLRDRVEASGGRLLVEPAQPAGTMVAAEWSP